MVVAWQVDRLIEGGLLHRFQNQALIEHLEAAQARSERLNKALATEVEQRRLIEARTASGPGRAGMRVAQRSQELDRANQALSKSEAAPGPGAGSQ